jgi:hypothetical protein
MVCFLQSEYVIPSTIYILCCRVQPDVWAAQQAAGRHRRQGLGVVFGLLKMEFWFVKIG